MAGEPGGEQIHRPGRSGLGDGEVGGEVGARTVKSSRVDVGKVGARAVSGWGGS
jgi:hypothetical protein